MRKNSSKNLSQKKKNSSVFGVKGSQSSKTIKKLSTNRTVCSGKLVTNSNIKLSQKSLIKPIEERKTQETPHNEDVVQENQKLREEFCKLQDSHLKDK